jgi:hypothetical protein
MNSPAGPSVDAEQYVSERSELKTVLESGIFGAYSNAAKLLRFVCERHFRNPAETITEYDVGVHGLGRRSKFDPQCDSIVRVEAHRVRKRLQEYYSNEGASHPIKIVLSRGQYAPQFVRSEPPADAATQPAAQPDRMDAAPGLESFGAGCGRMVGPSWPPPSFFRSGWPPAYPVWRLALRGNPRRGRSRL